MSQKKYGYVRVSTKEQNLFRQIDALKELHITDENIFWDKFTGTSFLRPGYAALLEKIQYNDLLVINSIDRLGRNYNEVMEQWRKITKNIGADIMVLDMPLLDTRNNQNGLTGAFISDLVLQILSYVSEIEKEKISQRQKEGIKSAQKRGVKFGRPRKDIDIELFYEVTNEWRRKNITCKEAIERLKISRSYFYILLKRYSL